MRRLGIDNNFRRQLLQITLTATLTYVTSKIYYANKGVGTNDSSFGHVVANKERYIFEYPEKVYGHVHVAKTGGTTLNGIMANKFTRVCGHKGYSYDAYMDNERWKNKTKPKTFVSLPFSRSRVQFKIMQEIGYDDCDYVSLEQGWKIWSTIFPNGNFHGVPVELHVPCRDPLDHFMSQTRGKFSCNETDQEFYRNIDRRLILG